MKNIITVALFSVLLFSFSAMCYFGEDLKYTEGERRLLATRPELTSQTVADGSFMENFEVYAVDQFPFREKLRSVKAVASTLFMRKLENNGLFYADGHLSKLDEEENEYMMNYAAELFRSITDKYVDMEKSNVYFSIVPDKNYYLAKKNGYPSLDYERFVRKMREKTEFMTYIDITKELLLSDYYRTDTHWKQENISGVAQALANAMGTDVQSEYEINTLDIPFKGVYLGQSALPVEADTLKYLTNEALENCVVTYYDNGKPEVRDMYDMEKAYGKDSYEIFLSGSSPIVTIENPNAKTDKELVLFRDSFGGPLAPLLAEGYKKITAVDIRYVQSNFIGNLVNFESCDVLFLYSASLLNNSIAMK